MANQSAFAQIEAVADRYLDRNGRRYVTLSNDLFGFKEKLRI